jgi:hypothetical protein
MKKIIGIILLTLLFGCGGGGGGGGGNPAPTHVPVIEDVGIYYWDTYYGDYIATDELARGDDWYYDITIVDAGMDAWKSVCSEYFPIDAASPWESQDMLLPSQNAVRQFYYEIDDVTVAYDAPLGNYRLDFQVVDRAGNKSAVYTKFIKVTW